MKMVMVALMAMAGFGCSTVRGAITLTPASVDPNQGVWVFIESSSAGKSGVYRCKDVGDKPVCRKADW